MTTAPTVTLRRPAAADLPGYVDALRRGWSPDTVRGAAAAADALARIDADADAFLAALDDPDARGGPVTLPDGTLAARLPGFTRWVEADGAFAGAINLRWQRGTAELPPHVLGHIGYAIVPWQQRRGIATRALALLLPSAWARGLPRVELACDADNAASARVIAANGGRIVERFTKPPAFGAQPSLRWRIDAPAAAAIPAP